MENDVLLKVVIKVYNAMLFVTVMVALFYAASPTAHAQNEDSVFV